MYAGLYILEMIIIIKCFAAMKSLQAASHECAYHSSSLCLYDMSTYLLCLMSSTGGVYLWLFGRRGGVTVTMSTGRVSSPSLTPTNIHLISSLHPCSETPAWPLPHSLTPPLLPSSFCLSVSHLHFDLRRDELRVCPPH